MKKGVLEVFFANKPLHLKLEWMPRFRRKFKESHTSRSWRVKRKSSTSSSNDLLEQIETVFFLHGVPFCKHSVISQVLSDGSSVAFGAVPKILPDDPWLKVHRWPSINKARQLAITKLKSIARKQLSIGLRIKEKKSHSSKCFAIIHGRLKPLWVLQFEVGPLALPYKIYVDAMANYEVQPQFLHFTTGKVQAFARNPDHGRLLIYDFRMLGDGTLNNENFITQIYSSPDASNSDESPQRAYSKDHKFIFLPEDEDFAEASIFAHAQNMYDFFEKIRILNRSPEFENQKIELIVHAYINNTKNNALFSTGDIDSGILPRIYVGDGDGVALRNLALDQNVTGHEYSHSRIISTLSNTTGQALVLHEGLADFFVFAYDGDSCLGDSVCPIGSFVCYVRGECLRTGDFDLNYTDPAFKKLSSHQKGQLISSYLWSLRDQVSEPGMVTQIVYKALEFLIPNTDYGHFILSLMLADKELFGGRHNCLILNRAWERGLGEYLQGLDCGQQGTAVKKQTRGVVHADEIEVKPSQPKNEEDQKIFFCSLTREAELAVSQPNGAYLILLAYMMPLVLAFMLRMLR